LKLSTQINLVGNFGLLYFRFCRERKEVVSKTTQAQDRWALLLCVIAIIAGCAPSAFSQAAAKPAPVPTPAPADSHARATLKPVDSSVPGDPSVEKMLEAYAPKVRALSEVIGKLKGDLTKTGIGAGSMGNFVADAIRDRAQVKLGKPVILAITNSGGLRRNSIPEGDLKVSDIFEVLPFENTLVTLDLTGEQLLRFMTIVVSNRDAQSGAHITFRTKDEKSNELVSVRLRVDGQEKEIDPKASYTIVTIDYLVKRGGEYSILQEGKNMLPLNLTLRDALIDYVRAETAAGRTITSSLDGRFSEDKGSTQATPGAQPQ
jgi:2',3'-cyclic-nucleotide 2'-phosphodiesterase (5'-nucleotidase family)